MNKNTDPWSQPGHFVTDHNGQWYKVDRLPERDGSCESDWFVTDPEPDYYDYDPDWI